MDQVLKHAYEQLFEKEKVESNMNDAMEALVKGLVEQHDWPFSTVTPEEYLSVVRPLGEIVYDIYSGKIDGEQLPAEVFYDKITYCTMDWLKCMHQMEYETLSNEIQEEICSLYGFEHPDTAFYKRELLEKFKEYGFELNTRALEYMAPFFEAAGINPLFVQKENEKDYIPEQVVETAKRVYAAHESSYKSVLDRTESIIADGLPSEHLAGKIADRISGKQPNQQENARVVKDLVRREVDKKLLELMADFHLQEKAIRSQGTGAQLEASNEDAKAQEYFAQGRKHEEAHSLVTKMRKESAEREKQMDPTKSIELQEREGTFVLTAKMEKGARVKLQIDAPSVSYTGTHESRMKARSRIIELGSMTREVYQEQSRIGYVLKKDTETLTIKTHNPEKDNERKKTTTEKAYGEVSLERTKTTRFKGRRSARLEMKANVARLEHRVVKQSDFGYKTKEEKVWSAKAEILGGSATVKDPTLHDMGSYVISAEAHAAKGSVEAQIKNVPLKVDFNIGVKGPDLGYQLDTKAIRDALTDRQKMKKVLVFGALNTFLKGPAQFQLPTQEENPLKKLSSTIIDLVHKEGSIDLGSLSVSAGEFKLFKAEFNQGQEAQGLPVIGDNVTLEMTSPLINDVIKDVQDGIKTAPAWVEKAQTVYSNAAARMQEAKDRFQFDETDYPGKSAPNIGPTTYRHVRDAEMVFEH